MTNPTNSNDATFPVRVIIAKEPGHSAFVVAGISDNTWEVISPEEWDEYKRKLCEQWIGPDWTTYDLAEAVLRVPQAALDGLFSPPINVSLEARDD